MGRQEIFTLDKEYKKIVSLFEKNNVKKVFYVHGKTQKFLEFESYMSDFPLELLHFSEFSSNPTIEEVKKGVSLFQETCCHGILAVGGGSALDVAKGIKYFSNSKEEISLKNRERTPAPICLIAIPTTAGTGSESTDFAVIYEENIKYSLYHPDLLPHYVCLEYRFLESLPLYQKKCTFLDALCQGMESLWSLHATEESKAYGEEAVHLLLQHKESFLANENEGLSAVLLGANLSGRAIQITKTTAPHGMSYGITSLFHLPHGHAVALCFLEVWCFMTEALVAEPNLPQKTRLTGLFNQWDCLFHGATSAQNEFRSLLTAWDMLPPPKATTEQIKSLTSTVNVERMRNHPIALTKTNIHEIYKRIFIM